MTNPEYQMICEGQDQEEALRKQESEMRKGHRLCPRKPALVSQSLAYWTHIRTALRNNMRCYALLSCSPTEKAGIIARNEPGFESILQIYVR